MGHVGDWEWAQNVKSPATPEALACEYTWVVLNSGMRNTVARKIFDRIWPLVSAGLPIGDAFKHEGKRLAIQAVWRERRYFCGQFMQMVLAGAPASELIEWCESLPWIGPITRYHLAKNLGVDCAKPDRWLVRLADAEGSTVDDLCARLAQETGDRVATVDVVLWRACSIGLLVIDHSGVRARSSRCIIP